MNEKMRLGVIFGGRSGEHEVFTYVRQISSGCS